MGQPITLFVLGPSNFPTSFDLALVRQTPALGVICALIHESALEAEEHYMDTLLAIERALENQDLVEETRAFTLIWS